MINGQIAQYLALKKQMVEIEAQLEALKPIVTGSLREYNGRIQFEGYDFILSRITTWTFSPDINTLQEALTEAKRREKQSGVATIKEQREVLIVREHRERKPISGKHLAIVREAYPRAYEKWTPEEDDVLRSEFQQGQTIQEIAVHLQRQIGGIRSRLVKQGLIEK